MNEIFKLFGTIGINSNGAEKDLDNITKKAQKVGDALGKIGSAMQNTGKKLTTAITAPVVAGITASIKSFADLEQAIGGIETLFKGSSDKVIKSSESAYRRAGVSGTQYMEQVTAFSASLLQGLGGDTEKAANVADMAMVDMSDNANKFGSNIGDVQNAYQGFAKSNYTMLDNLRLGYGGTASEMARLIEDSGVMGDTMQVTAENVNDVSFDKIIEAIHVVQDEMDITGTTAKEAEETVAGSFGMMKASLQDLAAGFGQENADMEMLMENFAGSVSAFADNIKRVLSTMWDNLPLEDWQKWTGAVVVAAGPVLYVLGTLIGTAGKVATAFQGAGGFMAGMAKLFPNVSAGLGLIKGAFGALLGPAGVVIAAIAVLVGAFVTLWNTNEGFRNKIIEIWTNIKTSFEDFVYQITEKINALGFNFESFGEMLRAVWDKITEFLAPVFIYAFEVVESVIDFAFETILDLFDLFVAVFNGDWEGAWQKVVDIFGNIVNTLGEIFEQPLALIKQLASDAFTWISEKTTEIWEGIKVYLAGVWEGIKTSVSEFFEPIKTYFSEMWEGIKTTFNETWTSITTFLSETWETITNVITVGLMFIGELFSAAFQIITLPFMFIWENIKEYVFIAWEYIKGVISDAITAVKTKIDEILTAIRDKFTEIWTAISNFLTPYLTAIKTFITETFTNIKNAVTEKVEAVRAAVSEKFTAMKNKVTEIWNAVKTAITTKINEIKAAVSQKVEEIRAVVTEKFNAVKNKVTEIWNGIKSAISNKITEAKTAVSSKVGEIQSTVSSKFNDVKSNVTNTWNSIKDAIMNPINKARDAVRSAIDKMKGYFNFSWSLPKLKMPHFGFSGKFSLNPPSVPKFNIDWYKDGGIMQKAMAFGMNGNDIMAGGEAGKEAILPLNRETLGGIGLGIANTMNVSQQALIDEIQNLRAIVSEYLPLAAEQKTMVINSGALVGSIMPEMNKQLGNNINLEGRGR